MNVTLREQLLPAVREVPQVVVSAKSALFVPVNVGVFKFSVALPAFVRVTD